MHIRITSKNWFGQWLVSIHAIGNDCLLRTSQGYVFLLPQEATFSLEEGPPLKATDNFLMCINERLVVSDDKALVSNFLDLEKGVLVSWNIIPVLSWTLLLTCPYLEVSE